MKPRVTIYSNATLRKREWAYCKRECLYHETIPVVFSRLFLLALYVLECSFLWLVCPSFPVSSGFCCLHLLAVHTIICLNDNLS
jgi:hypothetical protein